MKLKTTLFALTVCILSACGSDRNTNDSNVDSTMADTSYMEPATTDTAAMTDTMSDTTSTGTDTASMNR